MKAFIQAQGISITGATRKNDLITKALECWKKEVVLEIENEETQHDNQSNSNLVLTNRIEPTETIVTESTVVRFVSSDNLLKDNGWLLTVKKIIGDDRNYASISTRILEHASLLESILRKQLVSHLHSKVENAEKHKHWCIVEFVMPNIGHLAALMLLQEQIQVDNLSSFHSNGMTRLLKNPTTCNSFLPVSNRIESYVGCYLYFDNNKQQWVRSGKANKSFQARHKEHEKESMNLHADSSKFYLSYPHKSKYERDESIVTRRAWFEQLTMYMGCGFPENNENENDHENEGLAQATEMFLFSDSVAQSLSNVLGTGTLVSKKYTMVAYLLELGYDLLLCPEDNVSGSAGFEPFLGTY